MVEEQSLSLESQRRRALYLDVLAGAEFSGKDPGGVSTFDRLRYLSTLEFGDGFNESLRDFYFALDQYQPFGEAIRQTNWSVCDLSNYRTAPDPSSPLLTLRRFMIFGLDFKVTPEGEMRLIEINGLNSGMKGYAKTRSCTEIDNGLLRSDKALSRHLQSYGERELAFLGSLFVYKGYACSRFVAVRDLVQIAIDNFETFHERLQEKGVHEQWIQHFVGLADEILRIETLTHDKFAVDELLGSLRDIKPESYRIHDGVSGEIQRDYGSKYLVCKPRDGSIGRDVQIFPVDEFNADCIEDPSNFIAEPFIDSFPIYSNTTGMQHDGCMRYVVIAEEDLQGDTRYRHLGGYWRLCPEPIHFYGNLDAMRANYHKKALHEILHQDHSELAAVAAEEVLDAFWKMED